MTFVYRIEHTYFTSSLYKNEKCLYENKKKNNRKWQPPTRKSLNQKKNFRISDTWYMAVYCSTYFTCRGKERLHYLNLSAICISNYGICKKKKKISLRNKNYSGYISKPGNIFLGRHLYRRFISNIIK